MTTLTCCHQQPSNAWLLNAAHDVAPSLRTARMFVTVSPSRAQHCCTDLVIRCTCSSPFVLLRRCVVCPYHGWAFDAEGKLRDVPSAEHGSWPKRPLVSCCCGVHSCSMQHSHPANDGIVKRILPRGMHIAAQEKCRVACNVSAGRAAFFLYCCAGPAGCLSADTDCQDDPCSAAFASSASCIV